ncbi:MAG: DUF4388 domain-containing protein [Chloroflexota bacterium]|nr:DUF4388 domain-containing protein [Chloroflexota bacterium]
MGDLADIPVPDLLFIIGQRRLSGRLLVQIATEEVSVYVLRGAVAMVTSSLPTMRLGSALVRDGLITEANLRDALAGQEETVPTQRLGDIVVERGWVDPARLAACIENQSIDLIARVVSADSGSFLFSRDLPLPATSNLLELKAERLVLEATRRRDELDAGYATSPPSLHVVDPNERLRPFALEDTWPTGTTGYSPADGPATTATHVTGPGPSSPATPGSPTDPAHEAARLGSSGFDSDGAGAAASGPVARAYSGASASPVGQHDPEYGTTRLANSILSTRRRRSRRLTRG